MTSLLDAPPAEKLRGSQFPRICTVPPVVSSAGQEAVELAAGAGLVLDPWEAFVLEQALGEREDGSWAAFEVGLIVGRQNGKGAVLEARELAGLFLFKEQLILHSAHEFKTAQEAFLRIKGLIDNVDSYRRRVRTIRTSHGEEGIELTSGQRLRFVARSRTSGRGFSGDTVILDEAFELPEAALSALLPTMAARPNPQIWYTSSAANRETHHNCRVLSRVRKRGLRGDSPRLAYFEWSVDVDGLDEVERAKMRGDRAAWVQSNPGLGIRINEEFIESELGALSAKDFEVERLGIGDWPPDDEEFATIDARTWSSLADRDSKSLDPVAFAVDVSRDRKWSAIAVAGRRADGRGHGEVVDCRPGTDWVVPRMVELTGKWRPCVWLLDPASPAGALIKGLDEAGLRTKCVCHGEQGVQLVSAREKAQACGALFDACVNDRFRHLDQPHLNLAVAKAATRPADDVWVWSRKNSPVDISPLWAVTLAKFGFDAHGTTEQEDPALWAVYD